jgi:tRNA (guanine-N7-)-methyltransferase
MKRRNVRRGAAPVLTPGQIEYEFGVPIAGQIVERPQWAATALKRLPESGPVDWPAIFGRSAPLVVDIGCGNGRYTLASAVERSECNHLAADSLPAVVRYGTRRANQRGLANVRFAVCDGWRLLHDYCAPESIAEIHIYHPQPYADPNKANLRMLTPDFMVLMLNRLASDGRVFLQTDRVAYWQYMNQAMGALCDWHEEVEGWPDEPEFRSRREILARKQGLTIYRGWGRKHSDRTDEQLSAIASELEMPMFEVEP